jgi:two-component system catabolic regulation response regulator CreB
MRKTNCYGQPGKKAKFKVSARATVRCYARPSNDRHQMNYHARMKILIVDDEPAIADTLSYALRAEGFTVDCCTLGSEALSRLASDTIDFVVLDVGLPDMTGFDVCRALRRHSDVPVLFLTARADEVDRIVGLELGGDDYVTKPFSPREVASRIRAISRRLKPENRATNGEQAHSHGQPEKNGQI